MNPESVLRVGSANEPPLQASKWLQLQLLADRAEMESLFSALGAFSIYRVGAVCGANEGFVSHSKFLDIYGEYVKLLSDGQMPQESRFRSTFSSVFTQSSGDLFSIPIQGDRRILRVARPVLQLQLNKIAYSTVDGKFRAMVFGPESIYWGLQFSYPQLFRDDSTGEVYSALESGKFPNCQLYKLLQRWIRAQTIPTPFQVENKRINVPFRLGKQCLSWINNHPQLVEQHIAVIGR